MTTNTNSPANTLPIGAGDREAGSPSGSASRTLRERVAEAIATTGVVYSDDEALTAADAAIDAVDLGSMVLKSDAWDALQSSWHKGYAKGKADAAIAEGMAWRQIETAPKDGSEVLLWLGAPWSKCEKARWYSPWSNWQCGNIPEDPAREDRCGIGSSVPTHWMPLPSPPNRGEQ